MKIIDNSRNPPPPLWCLFPCLEKQGGGVRHIHVGPKMGTSVPFFYLFFIVWLYLYNKIN
jgi:hypothetical protein